MPGSAQVSALLQQWRELRARGQKVSAEEMCRSCPELLPELQRQIRALEAMGEVVRVGGPHLREESAQVGALLHLRLTLVCLLFLAPTALVLALTVVGALSAKDQQGFTHWLDVARESGVLTAYLVMLLVLRGRSAWSLRGLRAFEMVLFGASVVFLMWGQYRWYMGDFLKGVAQPGQESKMLQMAGDSVSFPWFLLLVLYGAIIPNTGRRCALVVASLAASGLLFTVFLGTRPVELAPFALRQFLFKMIFWTSIGVTVAIYGSVRLSALHQEALAARRLGQYRLKRRLGAGGMGEVYLAEHQLLRRPCAVKLIRPEQAGDPGSLERFEREVQVMATLTHWNTVEIFDYGHADDGTFYYVMEYLPGLSLEQLIDEHGPMPATRAVHLLRQVCQALREAHAIGLVHRDIKPSNVIVCERGGIPDVVKLLDFGLVQSSVLGGPARLTSEGAIVGTPLYMSPEQAAGESLLDARTDIYSLGGVAYFLLTGQPVFLRDNPMRILAAHISEPVLPLTHLNADVPHDLQNVVLRCLEKQPGRRYPDADSLDEALGHCLCAGQWTQDQAADWWRRHGRKLDSATQSDLSLSLPSSTFGTLSPKNRFS